MRLSAITQPALVKSRRDRLCSLLSTLSLVVSTHACLAGCAVSAGDKLRFVPTTAQEATAALAERWELACETEAAEAVSMSPEDLNLVYLNSISGGGQTCFPQIDLQVAPHRGRCPAPPPSTAAKSRAAD